MPQTKQSSTKKSTSKSKKKTSQSTKRPIRREVGGVFCLLLGVFAFLGYFNNEGWFINKFCELVKGLIGWGFYFVPPALIICAFILLFHKGRPVAFRVVCTLLLPVFIGAIYQLFAADKVYDLALKTVPKLWKDGIGAECGGTIAGMLSIAFEYLFSKTGAAIVFIVLSLFCLFMSFNRLIKGTANKVKNRERREYEYIPEPEPAAAKTQQKIKAAEPVKNTRKKKPNIDIPMDDEVQENVNEENVFVKKDSFFNKKPRVRTPDELFEENKAPETENHTVKPQEIKQDIEPAQFFEELPKRSEPVTAPAEKPIEKKVKPVEVKAKEPIIQTDTQNEKKESEYQFPPISLLTASNPFSRNDGGEEISTNRERLETTLKSFGINAQISTITRGPSVTRYEMELEAGVKLNKITNLSDDIALSLGASGVRIAAIPNKISTIGIEVPNKNISTVYLRDIIDSDTFKNASSKLTFAIGKNISGEAIVGNISKLPHMLVAGTTGSGKSVCLNSLILSILYKATPDEVKFIMVDPKMVEFKIYNGIPHLLVPVVTEAKKAAGALQWAVFEMMKRYRLFSETGARDIASYNKIMSKTEDGEQMPNIVVVIDELADLMMVAAKEVEESVCRVAQMGRAAGVHLVIATQSPRADVITGLMKANIPSRIALKVSSALESRIILDAGGNADKLVGNGDMLYAPIGSSKPLRIQGTWVSDEERENILDFIKKSSGEASYSEDVMSEIEKAAADNKQETKTEEPKESRDDCDELFPQAVDVLFESGQASVSMLQRRLKLGYARAARLIDQMEDRGIVGPFEGSKPRQLLITKAQWQEMQYIQGTAPIEKPPEAEDPNQTMFNADDLFDNE